jgi:hypothetical protein
MNRRLLIAVVLGAVAMIAGCGEREQTALYKDGKYRGKPDTRPWDNAPPTPGSAEWKKDDHASWENAVRARSAGQNESRRIGH